MLANPASGEVPSLLSPSASLNGTTPPSTVTTNGKVNGTIHADTDSDSDLSDLNDDQVEDIGNAAAGPAQTPESPADSSSSSSEQNDEDGDGDFEVDDGSDDQADDAAEEEDSDPEPIPMRSRSKPKTKKAPVRQEYDPDLYGLRRSSRAAASATRSRPIIDSTDDDDDDDDGDEDGEEEEESEEDYSDAPKKRSRAPRKKAPPRSNKSSNRPTPIFRSETESESDEYGSSSRRNKSRRKRTSNVATPAAELRFSTRAANKVTNYNEDDDFSDEFLADEDSDTKYDEADMADVKGIDIILDHRMKEGSDPETDATNRHALEFNVKWTGESYVHATWESAEMLAGAKGFRKLDNYMRKVRDDAEVRRRPGITREDLEILDFEREQVREQAAAKKMVERIVASREAEEGGEEYLVKWKLCNYEQCTWEKEELVSEIGGQSHIDAYINRIAQFKSSKPTSSSSSRPKYRPLSSQPSYIKNGELRDFQMKGLNWLIYNWTLNRNSILADEMGLGKTVQTISFLSWIKNEQNQPGPFLVVVPLSTVPSWCEAFNNWAPDLNYVVYTGPREARDLIVEHELFMDNYQKKTKFHVLLTTYEFVNLDSTLLQSIKWNCLAVDEAHRLKNTASVLYETLKSFKTNDRLLITGTPLQNNLGELSALLDFIMPGQIDFVDEIDLQSAEADKEIARLQEALKPYILRRVKKDVEKSLPQKTEKIIRVELSDIQTEWYKNILTRNYSALNNQNKQKLSLLNIVMELKKISNHPYMFPSAEDEITQHLTTKEDTLKAMVMTSGKMVLLDRLLTKLKQDNHRVLIFSQMVKMLDLLSDYCRLRNFKFQRLDGTIPAGPRRAAIDHFNAPGSEDFMFLLSTRAGGLGINLMTADTVIIFDSDWNPQADMQAMARAHRIGQKSHVMVYRFVSKDTIEEEVLERARMKLLMEFAVYMGITDNNTADQLKKKGDSTSEISSVIAARAQKMFESNTKDNQKKLEDLDIDDVLMHAEDHDTSEQQANLIRSEGGEAFQQLMKQFEVTDVDFNWDDIMPPETVEALKKEEKEKEDQQFLDDQIAQNAKRSRRAPQQLQIGDDNDSSGRGGRKPPRKRNRESAVTAQKVDVDDSEEELDPDRALEEREIRHLYNAYIRYGDPEERYDDIVRDARILDRNPEVVKEVIAEMVRLSKEAVANTAAVTSKKDKKAILFEFRGVKDMNAEKILQIPELLSVLRNSIRHFSDPMRFRIPDVKGNEKWSCDWGAKEDGMLLVGINKHGYKNWTGIRDDPELGLTDKFFLEEHRVDKKQERGKTGVAKLAPGAEHLSRRANYLLNTLKERAESAVIEKGIRSQRAHKKDLLLAKKGRGKVGGSSSASPIPMTKRTSSQGVKRGASARNGGSESPKRRRLDGTGSRRVLTGLKRKSNDEMDKGSESPKRQKVDKSRSKHRDDRYVSSSKDDRRHRHSDKHVDKPRKGDKDRKHDDSSQKRVDQEAEEYVWPVRKTLYELKSVDLHNVDPDKRKETANKIRDLLFIIGNHVQDVLVANPLGKEERDKLKKRLWEAVVPYYPINKINSVKIEELYQRILSKKEEQVANANANTNANANAAATAAAATATTNAAGSANATANANNDNKSAASGEGAAPSTEANATKTSPTAATAAAPASSTPAS